jgi:hypothetical protein
MANRNIKDAKDLTTGELVYFRSHAKATYMSDGRTVEDAINSAGTGGGADMSNYYTKAQVDAKGYLTSVPSEYVTEAEMNNKGYLTSVPSEYVTETEMNNKGYLTSIPSEYITETELNTVLGNLKFTTITQTAYDNLLTKDPNTIYIISE